jgi:acyl phosphate:glycerol-3-phosphate acyltransferase
MFPITKAVLLIVISYLVGSIPMGLVVARIAGGIDIREHGSGNIGLTNVIRTLGWGPGLVTGVLDFLKGYLPVLIAMKSFSPQNFGNVPTVYESIIIIVATVTLLGNLWPVYTLFKGGKGVATGLGIMSALLGVYIFIPIAIFGIVLFAFRLVSLASIVSAISIPLTVLVISSKLPFITDESTTGLGILSAFTWAAALLIVWKHRANIGRIIKGEEPRVGKPKDPEMMSRSSRWDKPGKNQDSEEKETPSPIAESKNETDTPGK